MTSIYYAGTAAEWDDVIKTFSSIPRNAKIFFNTPDTVDLPINGALNPPTSQRPVTPNTPIGDVEYTKIVAYIDGKPIRSYNIGGFTCIWLDELANVFGYGLVWDGAAAELRMTTRP